ncbi:MAG TPA: CDP-alcohol phosphatidyltransferase family protein [Candidatus Nanoarchaeia archaeon]|nr:CDP-alcohol phosphatidyltransferase family protein [Candidatus Nanoarchaeia archaeon]
MVSIRELRKRTQSKRRGLLYTLHDYLAYFPAKLFLYTSLTANQITVLWIVVQFAAALFMATGDRVTMIIALVVFQAMFIIDCTDGIVARYKKQFTINGIYLDYIGHYVNNPTLLISLGYGVSLIQNNFWYLFVGIGAALAFLLNKAITLNIGWYTEKKHRIVAERSLHKSYVKNQNKLVYFVFEIMRIEYLFNAMFWGVLFGYAHIVLIVYAVFYVLELGRKMLSQFLHNTKN